MAVGDGTKMARGTEVEDQKADTGMSLEDEIKSNRAHLELGEKRLEGTDNWRVPGPDDVVVADVIIGSSPDQDERARIAAAHKPMG